MPLRVPRIMWVGIAIVALMWAGLIALLVAQRMQGSTGPTGSQLADIRAGTIGPNGEGTRIDPPAPLKDFTLPSSNGGELSLHDLRGKYVLLFFGYTHCPDLCPTTLAQFSQIKQQLGSKAKDVSFVFVSVDPDRDTPAVLRRYVRSFDPSFIGLSGDHKVLDAIKSDYGLYYQLNKDEGANYTVNHSSSIYLIDPDGRLIMVYSYGTNTEVITRDLERMLS